MWTCQQCFRPRPKAFASGGTTTLLLALLLVGARGARAQNADVDLRQLQARVETLERQNAELRQSILQRLPEADPLGESFTNVGVANLDTTQLHSLFDAYLAEQEAKKAASADSAAGYVVGSDLSMTATWKDGLELSTKNKDFRVHIGGRTQFDTGWFSADPNLYNGPGGTANPPTPNQLRDNGIGNTYGDGADVRRARFRIDGTMYETIEWAAEYDFINSYNLNGTTRETTAPTDLWWMFKELPVVQNIRIGNQKEAIGFEHIVSSRFQPFMERSYNQDTFYGGLFNGFIPGIAALGVFDQEEMMGTYHIGLFKPTNNVFAFNTGDGDYSLTGRLTRLLIWNDDGEQLLHIGGSLRQATAVSTNVGGGSSNSLRYQQFRTRDAIRTGLSGNWPTPANIVLSGDDEQTANGELVAVNGRWTFQSEYLVNGLQNARFVPYANGVTGPPTGPDVGTAVYHGGYVQLLYFLTDDHDHYSKKNGCFERVTPNENFFLVRDESGCRCFGTGAWQVGARYNYLDLNDKGLNGGILHNVSAGVNWFLNPNMKVQFNYMATYRDAPFAAIGANANPGDGWVNGWGLRLAHDF